MIKVSYYKISLAMRKHQKTFHGLSTVVFQMNEKKDTFLDFKGKTVHWVCINGTHVKENPFKNDRIHLKKH